MYSLYTVPIDANTYVMNKRIADFVAIHMAKPYFSSTYVQMYSRAVVCQDDGKIIGCALLRDMPDGDSGNEINIECLCVHEKRRNSGVGTDIVQYAVDDTKPQLPVLWVDKCSRHADLKKFYESNGFEVVLDQKKDMKMRLKRVAH